MFVHSLTKNYTHIRLNAELVLFKVGCFCCINKDSTILNVMSSLVCFKILKSSILGKQPWTSSKCSRRAENDGLDKNLFVL